MFLKSILFLECPLSAKYPQFNETDLVLESLVDKSTQTESFIEISNKLIKKVAGIILVLNCFLFMVLDASYKVEKCNIWS